MHDERTWFAVMRFSNLMTKDIVKLAFHQMSESEIKVNKNSTGFNNTVDI
jgi:hypothetical protein